MLDYCILKFMTVAWPRPKNSMSLVSKSLTHLRSTEISQGGHETTSLGHWWCFHASIDICDPIHALNHELLAKAQTASVKYIIGREREYTVYSPVCI